MRGQLQVVKPNWPLFLKRREVSAQKGMRGAILLLKPERSPLKLGCRYLFKWDENIQLYLGHMHLGLKRPKL